jgi:HD-GYP domain-containing protein (c-di-GMP phosphodiesterase class II)
MRKINVDCLEPGLFIARDIYKNSGELLLKAGCVLTTNNIKKLIDLGIPYIYVDDGLIPDIFVKDTISLETRIAAVRQIKKILLETKEAGQLVIDPQSLYGTVEQFTNELFTQDDLMLNLIDLRTQDDYTFAHSVNVCVLSLMTGITLDYNKEKLSILGIGALLHDLGKMMIPDAILNKPGKLSPREFAIMKTHTIQGYELISRAKNLGILPAIIALQHHESFDGSGYPNGISGDSFNELAQITAIADKFDALTANRIYRDAYPPHEAYEMCAASGNYLFKDYIVKAFLQNIAAYPSGTLVKLSDGNTAVALDTPKGFSMFPRVRVLFDSNYKPLPPSEISLADYSGLSVVKAYNNEEIKLLLKNKGSKIT